MTIEADSYSVLRFAGNDSATEFSITWYYAAKADVVAILVDAEGAETTLTLDTDYTLTAAGDDDGGTLTYPVTGDPLATGETLVVYRAEDIEQTKTWKNTESLDTRDIGLGDDKLTRLCQQLQEQLDRAVTWPVTTTGGETDAETWLAAAQTAQAAAQAAQTAAETAATAAAVAAAQAQSVAQCAHNVLTARDAADCHPQSAVTGLTNALDAKLAKASNLSDLTDAATARSNLGLGSAAVESVASGGTGGLLRADGDGSGLSGIVSKDEVSRANIALLAFRLAAQNGMSVQQMVDGFVDEFEDETGVSSKTNYAYDADENCYANYGDGTPVGDTASSTTNFSVALLGSRSYTISNDSVVKKVTLNLTTAHSGWIYIVKRTGSGTYAIESSTPFSHTGSGAETFTLSSPFFVPSTGDYHVCVHATAAFGSSCPCTSSSTSRFYITSPGTSKLSGTISCSENTAESLVTSVVPGVLAAMEIVSDSFSLVSQPENVLVVVQAEAASGATINTDYIYQASRDGGTTYSAVTLVEQFGVDGVSVVTGSVDVSGQPAGSTLVLKVVTTDSYEIKIHAQCGQGD